MGCTARNWCGVRVLSANVKCGNKEEGGSRSELQITCPLLDGHAWGLLRANVLPAAARLTVGHCQSCVKNGVYLDTEENWARL